MDAKVQELIGKLKEFEQEFGDDLDTCHPAAFELIYDIIKLPEQSMDELKSQIEYFKDEFMEEIEACNEDACNSIEGIFKIIS